jgi:hypothetical protein
LAFCLRMRQPGVVTGRDPLPRRRQH